MLRVDLSRREIVASVRDLAFPPGGLPQRAGRVGALRAELGNDVHRRYRRVRERSVPGFRGEVVLTLDHRVDGFSVRLHGRLDGLVECDDGSVRVEEVKSLAASGRDLDRIMPCDLPAAVLQARLYALLASGSGPVTVRLVLISIMDGGERTLDVPFDVTATRRDLDDRLRVAIASTERRARRANERAALAAHLRFPYSGHRLHQDELVEGIRRGLTSGRPVLAEAPTGIGKTAAALLPALEEALARDAVVFYLTAKRTQRARVAQTFDDVAAASGLQSGQLRALTLRPQQDMCPTGTLLCDVETCSYLANLHDPSKRRSAVDALLDGSAHIAPQSVFELGARDEVCPHVLSQILCAHVDLVIGDYNHVYGTTADPGLFPGADGSRPVLVVADEAHNLLDRAREHDSVLLSRRRVAALAGRRPAVARETTLFGVVERKARGPRGTGPSLGAFFREVLDAIDGVIDAATDRSSRGRRLSRDGCREVVLDPRVWDELALRGARLAARYLQSGAARQGARRDDPVLDAFDTLARLRDLTHRDDPALVPYAACEETTPCGRGVGICCVDPARRLAERHRAMLGTVAMSATLSPLPHYRAGLGFADLDPIELSLASPFPAEQRCVVVDSSIGTSWRERRHSLGAVATAIQRVVAVRPGHYVAFFPSYRFLTDVHERLDIDPDRLLVQRPRMADAERTATLTRLRTDPDPVLLLAVAGGVFAEGIDLPGDALIGAIVVGPALPGVGFERDAMRRYHDERGEDGFARAMLYPGMQRVIQAGGRVHRSAADRGVIVLLGHRFTRSSYRTCLPGEWQVSDAGRPVAGDPASVLERFWSGSRPQVCANIPASRTAGGGRT